MDRQNRYGLDTKQTAATSSAKPSSTPADCSNTASNNLATRRPLKSSTPSSVQLVPYVGNMRDARKLFRLFKTVNEVKKIKDLLNGSMNTETYLNIGVRGFFGVYWFFDNLNILSKIKLLSFDNKQMAKYGASFWLLALVTNLILLIKQLMANFKNAA